MQKDYKNLDELKTPISDSCIKFMGACVSNAIAPTIARGIEPKPIGFYKEMRGKGIFCHTRYAPNIPPWIIETLWIIEKLKGV